MESNKRWWALVAVALGTFITDLDTNIVSLALPSIQRDFGISLQSLEWIVSAYLLAFASLLLVGGRLGDVLGLRRAFLAGLVLFTLASVAAGLAPNETVLIAARVLQGVGGALITPAGLALLIELFPDPRQRATAIGIWGAIGAIPVALGPVLGGVLSQYASWNWIFLVNAPVGVLAVVISAVSMPRSQRHRSSGMDLPGLLVSALGLLAITYALIEGEARGWSSPIIVGSFVVAVLAAGAFLLIEAKSRNPMIDLGVFRLRVFSGGIAGVGLWAFGIYGAVFYLGLYLQNGLHFSPTLAGTAFIPMAALMTVAASLAPKIALRFGNDRTLATALGLIAISLAWLGFYGAGTSWLDLQPAYLLYAVGAGAFVPINSVVVAAVPPGRNGVASGTLNVSIQVSGLLGVAILGAVVSAGSNAATGSEAHRFIAGYQVAMWVGGIVVALGVPLLAWALRSVRHVNPEEEPADDATIEHGDPLPAPERA